MQDIKKKSQPKAHIKHVINKFFDSKFNSNLYLARNDGAGRGHDLSLLGDETARKKNEAVDDKEKTSAPDAKV